MIDYTKWGWLCGQSDNRKLEEWLCLNSAEIHERLLELEYEAQWIRKKLKLSQDVQLLIGVPNTLAGELHVLCSHAYGYETYIKAFKCNDAQGEIARQAVRIAALEDENAKLRKELEFSSSVSKQS